MNKQKALYGFPKYSPTLRESPAIKAYTTVKGVLVNPLREYRNRGIFAATMMRTLLDNGNRGCGGYFGVQWLGKKKDQLLFSIWDRKSSDPTPKSRALPLHPNCKRNSNDGPNENGCQCKVVLPESEKLKEGEELTLTVQREPVQTADYHDVTYKGHVWKVEFTREDEVVTLGRILFTDPDLDIGDESNGGIYSTSFFHEHIGCTPCGSFGFAVERTGLYITETAGNKEVPQLVRMYGNMNCPWRSGNCTCRSLDITSDGFGSVTFETGSEGLSPHWNVKEKVLVYGEEE